MEVIIKKLNFRSYDTIFRFYPLGDIHSGSAESAEDAIQKKVREIADTPNAYVLGIGDYTDCITKNDPRFDIEGLAPWVEKGNIVESQRERTVKLFRPLAEKNKIIALGTGNHEEEIHLRHQYDMTRNICKDLDVRYAGYSCFVILYFTGWKTEHHQFIWHSWHGAGAAQTEGARLMRLMRLVNEIQAHIYTMGHLHAMTSHTPDRLVCTQAGRVKSIRLQATLTGSWLKAYVQPKKDQILNPSYAEKKGYKPSRLGCPTICIRPGKEEIWIES